MTRATRPQCEGTREVTIRLTLSRVGTETNTFAQIVEGVHRWLKRSGVMLWASGADTTTGYRVSHIKVLPQDEVRTQSRVRF